VENLSAHPASSHPSGECKLLEAQNCAPFVSGPLGSLPGLTTEQVFRTGYGETRKEERKLIKFGKRLD